MNRGARKEPGALLAGAKKVTGQGGGDVDGECSDGDDAVVAVER